MSVKAVIFDFGGVLTSSPFEAFARYETANSLPRDLIRRINSADPDTNAWALFERAEIDDAGFDAKFLEESTALGHPIRGGAVLELLKGTLRPSMVAALRACKQHFKVGCITNNMASTHMPGSGLSPQGEVLALFDVVIESSKAGIRKPDPRIYLMMCERLDVAPAECVYLDDLGINCKPAATLGMKAIKVTSAEQALADLAAATGLVFEAAPA